MVLKLELIGQLMHKINHNYIHQHDHTVITGLLLGYHLTHPVSPGWIKHWIYILLPNYVFGKSILPLPSLLIFGSITKISLNKFWLLEEASLLISGESDRVKQNFEADVPKITKLNDLRLFIVSLIQKFTALGWTYERNFIPFHKYSRHFKLP